MPSRLGSPSFWRISASVVLQRTTERATARTSTAGPGCVAVGCALAQPAKSRPRRARAKADFRVDLIILVSLSLSEGRAVGPSPLGGHRRYLCDCTGCS